MQTATKPRKTIAEEVCPSDLTLSALTKSQSRLGSTSGQPRSDLSDPEPSRGKPNQTEANRTLNKKVFSCVHKRSTNVPRHPRSRARPLGLRLGLFQPLAFSLHTSFSPAHLRPLATTYDEIRPFTTTNRPYTPPAGKAVSGRTNSTTTSYSRLGGVADDSSRTTDFCSPTTDRLPSHAYNPRALLYSRAAHPVANLRLMETLPPILSQIPPVQDALVSVDGLTKLYGDFPAVTDLSFAVRPGEVIGLVGPNGAGKTSTLRCLAGIIPPSRGAIRICGFDMATQAIDAKKRLAFFSDEPRLFDYLTVKQHLTFTARIYNVRNYEPLAQSLLEELEIADKRDKLPSELSRGMKQKLMIACGLLHAPQVIFFDEPLTGLDPIGIRRMKDSILKRAREGAAIMISSHLLHLLEEVCSHVLILKNGRKIVDGSLAEVRARFSELPEGANLEDVFFRVTEEGRDSSVAPSAGGTP